MNTAKLRELLAKATPGEWTFRPSEWDDDQVVSGVGGTFFTLDCGEVMGMSDADAALICAMKNALPVLLDKVERYEAALREIASFELGKVSRFATKALEGAGHADG